ncbi:MAG: EAL domain-containing protein [Deltaproteobacteria bacterium]|nr:MAG: EAL domain-containing protein [Deltaproteobacteria bacterium]
MTSSTTLSSPSSYHVLVVDDHPHIRWMLQDCLTRWGYQVSEAKSAEDAIELLQESTFELMITDVHMPGKSGLELAHWAQEHTEDMAVIVMTGEASIESASEAIRASALDYLLKPLMDLGLVQSSVERALVKRQLEVELKLRLNELHASQASFSNVVEKNVNGILVLNKNQEICYANPASRDVFACTEESVHRLFPAIRPGETVEFERGRLSHSQSGYLEVHTVDTQWDGEDAYLITLRDITLRKEAELKLHFDAFHDSLTQLPNRALLMDRLESRIRRAQRRKEGMFAVLFIDLDRFKNINDSLGHTLGDVFLVRVGQRLSSVLRDGDTIARLSGDEFIILLDEISDVNDAVRIAERILAVLRSPFTLDNNEVFTSASIGITTSSIEYHSAAEVLRDADTAMYHAKAEGKARYELFDHAMHTKAVNFLRVETDLRLALQRNEFVLHYQPIVDLNRKQLFGFEALVRWEHPTRGLLYPGSFISVAEETGFIVPLGEWVLREACRQMKAWQIEGFLPYPVKMSVNVSYRQFLQLGWLAQIQKILKETGLDPSFLKIELTENVLIEHTDLINEILQELKSLNIQIDIDDFGTGFSSLSYLHRFPIDTLKIDRSFVSHMKEEGKNLEIVRSIVGLARNLGMNVVAEGIEHEDQLEQLVKFHCDYGQGYFFAKPLDAMGVVQFVRGTHRWMTPPPPTKIPTKV